MPIVQQHSLDVSAVVRMHRARWPTAGPAATLLLGRDGQLAAYTLGSGVGDSDESSSRDYVVISLILVLWFMSADYYWNVTLITLIISLLAGGFFARM